MSAEEQAAMTALNAEMEAAAAEVAATATAAKQAATAAAEEAAAEEQAAMAALNAEVEATAAEVAKAATAAKEAAAAASAMSAEEQAAMAALNAEMSRGHHGHLMHYKKRAKVLIIRKIGNCNMYHDKIFQTQTRSKEFSQNSVTLERIYTNWNECAAALLGCRSRVRQQIFGA